MVERGPEKAGVGSSILLLGILIYARCRPRAKARGPGIFHYMDTLRGGDEV